MVALLPSSIRHAARIRWLRRTRCRQQPARARRRRGGSRRLPCSSTGSPSGGDFGTNRLSKILARLRGDRTLYFDTSESIHAEAAKLVAQAELLLDTRFVVPPLLPLEIADVPAHCIHAFGWTRDQARKYLREHTILADQDVDNEVERYVTQPGQAVAYKIGQLEITRLRREAEERLGAKFDVRSFHAALLDEGPTSLPILGRRVERYVAARAAGR